MKPVPPVARAPGRLTVRVEEDNKGRQTVGLRAETVGRPRAETRATGFDRAGVHLHDASHVEEAVGLTRADNRDVVYALSDVWHPVGDRDAVLTVALPRPPTGQDRTVGLAHRQIRPLDVLWQPLAGETIDRWLRIKRVDVARTTVHEQEYDALGSRWRVNDFCTVGSVRSGEWPFVREKVGECQRTEACTGVQQKITSRVRRRSCHG